MPIVSDTGPLRYLIEIQAIDCLPRLYDTILTTSTVIEELQLPYFPPPSGNGPCRHQHD